MQAKAPSTPQLVGVQYLRAIAALMVAYFHALDQIPQYAPYLKRYLLGETHLANGVDLFFVISGFIMLVSSRRSRPGEFFARRLIRIVPLYWVLTTVLASLLLWHPELFRASTMGAAYFGKSLLFIPYANPAQNGQMFPLLVPGWSLNFEMFFYVVFTGVLFAPLNRRLLLMGLAFTVLVALGLLVGDIPYGAEIRFFTDFRLFEFLFGMAIAQLYIAGALRIPSAAACVLIAAGFLALLVGFPILHLPLASAQQVLIENALPAAGVVLGTVALEHNGALPKLSFLAYLGDASYSTYLSHVFSLGAARKLWTWAGLVRNSVPSAFAFIVFALALVVIGSILVYRFLEQPMLRGLQRRVLRRVPPADGGARAMAIAAQDTAQRGET